MCVVEGKVIMPHPETMGDGVGKRWVWRQNKEIKW
jgi:hypothetical protein